MLYFLPSLAGLPEGQPSLSTPEVPATTSDPAGRGDDATPVASPQAAGSPIAAAPGSSGVERSSAGDGASLQGEHDTSLREAELSSSPAPGASPVTEMEAEGVGASGASAPALGRAEVSAPVIAPRVEASAGPSTAGSALGEAGISTPAVTLGIEASGEEVRGAVELPTGGFIGFGVLKSSVVPSSMSSLSSSLFSPIFFF